MIHPRIDELLENVDSRYALVQAPPPLVESRSKNYLTMALEEVSEGKLKYKYPK
jgi:DNA-directed RNA polymerase subunit omega